MTSPQPHPSGLGRVVDLLRRLWSVEVVIGEPRIVLGPAPHVGGGRALPSSAVELQAAQQTRWAAAPEVPGDPAVGLAPLYRHADRLLVMPTVRLFEGDPARTDPSFLSSSHWLEDAFRRWRFPLAGAVGSRTVEEHLAAEALKPPTGLDLAAVVIRYALFGAARQFRLRGLVFPRAAMWVRPADGSPFAQQAARSLIVTARLDLSVPGAALPTPLVRAEAYRIRPDDARDRGIDPFHTPEGADIRLTGRLGVGVAVGDDRRLAVPEPPVVPDGDADPEPPAPCRSLSSARLPFAENNDPRRLLMAANMQTQAVATTGAEPPAVRVDDAGPEPPGVNLRVGYLAWRGWNHEDAWVLSESAAARLEAEETSVQVLERRALELDEPLRVRPDDHVQAGDLLIERAYAPVLLTDRAEVVAGLDELDERIVVPPEAGDRAWEGGKAVRVDEWDLFDPKTIPEGWVIADGLAATCRKVFRVHLRRRLPLSVGDKLANRHGHKGVVGAILPDAEMPRWRGRPLDALIDPVSVLNRSNWGQLRETLAGAQLSAADAADGNGRSWVEPPESGGWVRTRVRAIAGIQFVMRLPQHARDKLSGRPAVGEVPGLRPRTQRFGEMDHWALWAQGPAALAGGRLSPQAERLARLLACAGFNLGVEGDRLVLDRLRLDGEPPAGAGREDFAPGLQDGARKRRGGETLADAFDRLDAEGRSPRVLIFDPPARPARRVGAAPDKDAGPPPAEVRWLPLLGVEDRPSRRLADGSEEPHLLTRDLRRVVRAVRERAEGREEAGAEPDDAPLWYAVQRLMADAYTQAVGRSATGLDGNKAADLRREVLGRRVRPSGRGVIAPAGPLGLGLDEVGLPPVLARALFGPGLPDDPDELAKRVDGRTVWLKRDPVLHRWGLLALRARVVPGDVLRLSASLLGPLGADFDGDTVAVFAALAGADGLAEACRPSALAWDPLTERPMFAPGKQYLYGLHLIQSRPDRVRALDAELKGLNAPGWSATGDAPSALRKWLTAAAKPGADGAWWAVIERRALEALADDPGMELGLMPVEELRQLPAVRCGAAKNLYDGPGAAERMARLLEGRGFDAAGDTIASVMVPAKAAVGRFGGALRRLLYALPALTPELVRAAQCLTEQVTQRALSIKAGDPPLPAGEFEMQLRRLLRGEDAAAAAGSPLASVLAEKHVAAVWRTLRDALGGQRAPLLEWLAKPHELAEIVDRAGRLELPLDDLRLRCWMDGSE